MAWLQVKHLKCRRKLLTQRIMLSVTVSAVKVIKIAQNNPLPTRMVSAISVTYFDNVSFIF